MKNFLVVTEHPVERVLRVVVGLGLLSLVFVGPKTSWGWIGLLPLLTGATGLCPLYTILDISTCSKRAAG
jgi:Inner membrane protein YgaP-like, transmembrane domain